MKIIRQQATEECTCVLVKKEDNAWNVWAGRVFKICKLRKKVILAPKAPPRQITNQEKVTLHNIGQRIG